MTEDDPIDLFAGADPEPDRPARRCKVGKLLEAATDASREMFLDRLYSDPKETGWSDAALAKAVGRRVSEGSLGDHRRGVCICEPHPESERHTR